MGRWARGSMKNKAFSFKPAPSGCPRWILQRGVEHPPAPSKKNTHRQLATRRPSLKESSVSGKPYHCIIWRRKKHVSVHRSSSTNVIKVSIRHAWLMEEKSCTGWDYQEYGPFADVSCVTGKAGQQHLTIWLQYAAMFNKETKCCRAVIVASCRAWFATRLLWTYKFLAGQLGSFHKLIWPPYQLE